MSGYPEFNVYGLRFAMTCGACPEQYDVFFGDEQVGYVRLRHGYLTAEYPGVGGDDVLATDDVEGDGIFDSSEEREKWLKRIAILLHERHGTVANFEWSLFGD